MENLISCEQPTKGLSRLLIAFQTSRSCDERSTDCQLVSSSCRARIVRGEIAGEPCFLPLVHELQEQLNWYQVMTA